MTTLNISIPKPLRNYVEFQAAAGNYSTSEYLRHLIREDQIRHEQAERNLLWDYLALSAKELDEGDFANVSIERLVTQGKKRRRQTGSGIE